MKTSKIRSFFCQRWAGWLGVGLVALLFLATSPAPTMPIGMPRAAAQNASPLNNLTPDELTQVNHCVQEIKNRQIQSGTLTGAFHVANDGSQWVENYFGLQGALALLSVTNDGNSAEAKAVSQYLVWYASVLDDNEGIAHNYNPNKLTDPGYDSIDGVAGLYLLASARYYRLTGSLPPQVLTACGRSLQALNDVVNNKQQVVTHYSSTAPTTYFTLSADAKVNGLSIDTGSHCQHYLADNVEAFSGASESVALFAALGTQDQKNTGSRLVASITTASARFQTTDRFAFDVNELNTPLDNNPSRGLRAYANLYGLAFLPSRYPNLWAQLKADYGSEAQLNSDDANQAAQAPSELWLIAATRVSPQEATNYWRPRVVNNAKTFGNSTYIGRLAVTVLALVGNTYPTIKDTTAPSVAINSPTANQKVSPALFDSITGVASDNVGVDQVALQLSRVRDGATQYWDGNAFTSTVATLPISLAQRYATTMAWNYAVSKALKTALNAGSYSISVSAQDTSGNQSSTVGSFVIDASVCAWRAVDIAVGNDSKPRLLWMNLDGRMRLWTLGTTGLVESALFEGSYTGWSASAVTVGGSGKSVVLWTNSDGRFALHVSSAAGTLQSTQDFGPYSDGANLNWQAISIAAASDDTIRVLLRRTDGFITIWSVSANLTFLSQKPYGPYSGWTAQRIALDGTNKPRVLWSNSDGRMSYWNLDATVSIPSSHEYGPYSGWSPYALGVGTDGTGWVGWKYADDQKVSFWKMDTNGVLQNNTDYGPYSGWHSRALAVASDGGLRVLWQNDDGRVDVWHTSNAAVWQMADHYNYPPLNVTATAGSSQITIKWSATPNTSGYVVYRSLSNDGPFSPVGNPTGTTYTDTGLSNSAPYYYQVRGLTGGVESGAGTTVSATATGPSTHTVSAWFNDGWEADSRKVFLTNSDLFSNLNPFYYNLGTSDSGTGKMDTSGSLYLRAYAYGNGEEVQQIHAKGAKCVPAISDGAIGQIDAIFGNPGARQNLITNIVNEAVSKNFDGFDLDFESGVAANGGKAAYTTFVRDLAAALKAKGKVLDVTIGAFEDATRESDWIMDIDGLKALSDVRYFKILGYDKCLRPELRTSPSPIGELSWIKACLNFMVVQRGLPAQKTLIGIPNYSWTWKKSGSTYTLADRIEPYSSITSHQGVALTWNSGTAESTATWSDASNSYVASVSDSQSVAARSQLVKTYGLGGVAIFVLGREDPNIYPTLRTSLKGNAMASSAHAS